MKLIGSNTERDFRKQLNESYESLFNVKPSPLLALLQSKFPVMKTAYILNWIPEQGEDIYTIFIDREIIVIVELDRFNLELEPLLETISMNDYVKGLSKINQIKLAVAIDLASKQ
ncbi:hypothetical protein [Peribacillus alkalitolerans]|uniref:hypothetical protein n=1 Tax=Peribacillus alkalitolerans TaxID=1550385 RepID=UPI0013D085A2|nr:hypothetical protein [Peribacillus alkalitolerans]